MSDLKLRMDSRLLLTSIVLALLFLPSVSWAQTCASPADLCAEVEPLEDELVLPTSTQFGCIDVDNSFYYQFTTNGNQTNTGNVLITVDSINCPNTPMMDTLFAVVVLPAQQGLGDPCDPALWTQVGDCVFDTLSLSIETPDLLPNTSYFLILGSTQPANQMDCEWQVSIEGPAVDINGCCDDQISLGEASELSVIGGDTPPGYSWSPPSWLDDSDSDAPLSYPEETIVYTVTGSVGDCTVTDQVTIFVGPPISTFNTFTPNGDGINDTWGINGISQFSNAQVNVYDRWGQLVFKSLGYATPWDGTNKGKFLPTGTYYYVIELNSLDVNIPPVTGYVTIIN